MQSAQPTATAPRRPEDRSQEFVAVQGGPAETVSAGGLLVAAYLVMWALLMAFLFIGWRRGQALAARLEAVEKALEKHDAQG